MNGTRSRWLVIAIAALLVTPAAAVVAQNDTGNETDDGEDFEAEENETANETDEEEAEDEEDEADEEDEEDQPGFDDDDRRGPSHHEENRSDWEIDNGTYTGDHIQVTVDEDLPGLTDVTYLDPEAAVFASVQLAGDNLTYNAHGDMLAGETEENEFAVRDDDGGHLMLEGEDDNASVTIDVADGVDVNQSERYSDEEDAAYELHLDGNRTVWFYGEAISYDNGTFTVADSARLSPAFPPAEHDREEPEREHEDRREAGSQWDRSNDTFEGDHVQFTLDANETRILDYALKGSTIPVFAEVDIAEGNESEWRAHGKHFEMRQDDERIRVVDVPPSVLEVRAGDDSEAQLVLADGVNATEIDREDEDDEDERALYELSLAENRTAWLGGENLTLANGTFTVGDRALFRAMPTDPEASPNQGPGSLPDEARGGEAPEDSDEDEDDEREAEEGGPPAHARAKAMDEHARTKIEQAKAQGKVGVEVHTGDNGSQPVAVETGDVRVNRAWAQANGSDGVRAGMQIEAPDDAPGTTVTMNLEEADLEGVNVTDVADELAVSYDNETIAMADDLDDVLDPANDEGEPEYLLMVGGDGVQVLVSVPHFSPHTIEVYQTQSSGEQLDGNQAPGIGVVGLSLATGLASLIAVRRRN